MDLSPLWTSLKVVALATALSGSTGIGVAYVLAMRRFPGRGLLQAFTALPLTLPPTVLGYYLLVALGRGTALGQWVEATFRTPLVFTWQGAAVAAARAAFEEVDVQLLEAAQMDGAGTWQQFLWVLLPLAHRGILAGVTLGFARALGDFGTTLMVAGNIPGKTQTLPIALYDAVQAGRWDLAMWLAVVLTGVAVSVLLAVGRLGTRLV